MEGGAKAEPESEEMSVFTSQLNGYLREPEWMSVFTSQLNGYLRNLSVIAVFVFFVIIIYILSRADIDYLLTVLEAEWMSVFTSQLNGYLRDLSSMVACLFFVITRNTLNRADIDYGLNKLEYGGMNVFTTQLNENLKESKKRAELEFLFRKRGSCLQTTAVDSANEEDTSASDYLPMNIRGITVTVTFVSCSPQLPFDGCPFLCLVCKNTGLFNSDFNLSLSYLYNKGNANLIMESKQIYQKSNVPREEKETFKERISNATLRVVNKFEKCEKRLLSDLEVKFMEDNYKDVESNPYCWDLGFARDKSGKQALLDRLSPSNSQNEGDKAEMKVFFMLVQALKEAKIPSMVIGRYKYNQHLAQYLQICKSFGLKFKEGDIDVLLIIPQIGIFVIEVKGIREYNIDKVKFALGQCGRGVLVLAEVNCDIFSEENCTFLKVVALPNVSKQSIDGQLCRDCCRHFICKEDLRSTEAVLEWIRNISNGNTKKLKEVSKGFDGHIFKSFIGRLLTQAFIK